MCSKHSISGCGFFYEWAWPVNSDWEVSVGRCIDMADAMMRSTSSVTDLLL